MNIIYKAVRLVFFGELSIQMMKKTLPIELHVKEDYPTSVLCALDLNIIFW